MNQSRHRRKSCPIWKEFTEILAAAGHEIELERLDIAGFYASAGDDDVALTIATGEQRIYANVLLSIGAILPE